MNDKDLFRKICADFGTYQCQDRLCMRCPASRECLDRFAERAFRDEKTRSFFTNAVCPFCRGYREVIVTREFTICRRSYDRFLERISGLIDITDQLLREVLG